jgi:putative transposase
MTPAAVHFGAAPALWQQRAEVLRAAYAAHPERFKGKIPTPPNLPVIVGINLPKNPAPETTDDLIQTPALLTNLHTEVSHSH